MSGRGDHVAERRARLLVLAAVCALAALILLPAIASAAEEVETFTFDTLVAPVEVTTQYEGHGLVFAGPTEFGFEYGEPGPGGIVTPAACRPPYTSAESNTHSKPNDATIGCDGGEFFRAGTFGVLTNFAKRVSAYVGDPALASNTFRIDAYDLEKHLVASGEATTLATGVNTPISVEAPGGAYEIAYFAIYRTNPSISESSSVAVDDLTLVTNSEGVPAVSVASTAGGRIAQGANITRPVTIVRHNHSNGKVELKASGLPSGVAATFEPTVLGGTETKSTLRLTVEDGAPLTETTGLLEAEPKEAKAGKATSTVPITLAVVGPFSVFVGSSSSIPASTSISMQPCSSASVPVRTMLEPGFPGPVDLALASSGDTTGVSATLDKTVLEPGDFGFVEENEQTLHVSRSEAGPGSGSFQLFVHGTSGAFAEPAATVKVQRAPPTITEVAPKLRTPQALQPSKMAIFGSGFCPGTTVEFGNPDAVAAATVNSQGTALTAEVPRLATTGPVTVTSGGASASTPKPISIDSFRNVSGYPFHNYNPFITFDQLTEAFGRDQTYLTIDFCWPFGCDVEIPDPLAAVVQLIANETLDSGACFGISLSSQRFLEGVRHTSFFPPGSSGTAFGLDGSGGPSMQLRDFISAMHVTQLSTEFLSHWVAESVSQGASGGVSMSKSVFEEIKTSLQSGHYPLIALQEGTTGHVVVAYDLEGAPGDYYIDVYDSNDPFGQGGDENNSSDGSLHKGNVTNSRVHVGSDGEWTLPSTGISGGVTGLVVTDPYSIPTHPTIPTPLGLVKAIGGGVFGSSGAGGKSSPSSITQLTDASGHTLYAANGTLNTDPVTRLGGAPFSALVGATARRATAGQPAPMVVLPPRVGALHASVRDSSSGADTHTFLLHGFAAEVDTHATKGATDTLSVASGSGDVGFSTNTGAKPLSLTLLGGAGKQRRTARIATTSFAGPGDTLAFTGSQSGIAFAHHGAATTFSLTLSGVSAKSPPALFESGPLRVGAGTSVRVSGIHWGSLQGSAIRITIGRRTILVHNRARAVRLASVKSLSVMKGNHGRLSLKIGTSVRRLPKEARLAFTWLIRSGGHVLAAHGALGAVGARTATYTFTPRRKGRYTLTASVAVITTAGIPPSTARASRTLSFHH